jgi:hypothetical protein
MKWSIFFLSILLAGSILKFGCSSTPTETDSGDTTRIVLAELFTSTNCIPCKPANEVLDAFTPNHSRTVAIKYHVFWPGPPDPFYEENKSESEARAQFYIGNPNPPALPHFFMDGISVGAGANAVDTNKITTRESVSSPLTFNLEGTYDTTAMAGTLSLNISSQIEENPLTLHIVLIESEIHYDSATNGETLFQYVMRDMIPDAGGSILSLSQGDTTISGIGFTLNSTWVDSNCEIVAFIQRNSSPFEVIQATSRRVSDL